MLNNIDRLFPYYRRKNDKEADEVNNILSDENTIVIESLSDFQLRHSSFQDGWDCAVGACKREIKRKVRGKTKQLTK